MQVSRIDLDGTGSPEGLVTLILKAEKNLPIPVPIDELCRQLDITEIASLETEGFEGGLITDASRSSGIILVKQNSHPMRRRFTIAHELGHFLIPTHMPDTPGRFLCSRADMLQLTAKENDRRGRMEVEANRFASLILIPPPALRAELSTRRSPDLQHVPQLARVFQVSKEAMARTYAEFHGEPIAIVVVHQGKILRCYRNRVRFPFIQPSQGQAVPKGSLFYSGHHGHQVASNIAECLPDLWIDVERGNLAPTLREQVYLQQDGYALIMLHLVRRDEDDEAEEKDLERSWQVGFGRRSRK